MLTPRTKLTDIATRWLSLWNAPTDWRAFDALHAEYFKDFSPAGRPATKEGFAAGLREFIAAFPDMQIHSELMVADDIQSRVAIRWSASMTNRVKFLGVGPTNARTYITGIEIIEIEMDRIVKRWGEWDISRHLNQPGS